MKNLVKSVSCVLVGMAVFGFFSCKGETEYVDRIVEKEVEKPSDTTPPAQINAETVTATAGNNTVLLSWTNPSDEDFYGTEISFAPESSGVTQPVIVKGSQAQKSSVIFNGLANGTKYTFTLVALDKSLNRASGTTKTATPVSNADSTPPANVTKLVATAGNGKIILAWTNPADEDFFGVRISEKSNGGTLSNAVFLQNPANTFTVSELANGTAYEFSVIALDKALNESGAATAIRTPVDSADETPPENVTELTVVANDGNAVISWKNPTETDFAGVEVNANPAVGTLSYPLLLRKEANTLSVSGLTVGEKYEFTVKAYDQSLNFASGSSKTVTVGDTGDHTPPHIVANLRATNKGGAILLTWEEASDTDGDLLCYEVTYESVAITVSKGTNYCYVTNLTNGTEYTFTVKSVDTSGNKSEGVAIKETPVAINAGDTMKIELSAPEALSNTSTPVTAKITSASKIKKVVYKKNGSMNAAELIADSEANKATQKEASNDSEWIFYADEKTTYTVAAIDESGREETAQIFMNTIDKVPPAEVSATTSYYLISSNSVELTWEPPVDTGDKYDSPFDHVEIAYKKDGTDTLISVSEIFTKETKHAVISNMDNSIEYYDFYFYTIDKLGNKSAGARNRLYVANAIVVSAENAADKIASMIQSGTVKVTGKLTPDICSAIVDAIKKLPESIFVKLDLGDVTNTSLGHMFINGYETNYQLALIDVNTIQSIIMPNNLNEVKVLISTCENLTNLIFGENTKELVFYIEGNSRNLNEVKIPQNIVKMKINLGGYPGSKKLFFEDTTSDWYIYNNDTGKYQNIGKMPEEVSQNDWYNLENNWYYLADQTVYKETYVPE